MMNQSLGHELFDEALRQYRKNNLKKVLKIVDKRLTKFPEDQIKILKILTNIDKDPQKIDDYIPYLRTIAVSKLVHGGIVEAIVFCCLSAQKELLLIELLHLCLESDKSNKEAASQLFAVSSRNDFFHVQIKAARCLFEITSQLKYSLWSILCGFLTQKYYPKNAEEAFETSIPVVYAQRKLVNIINDNLKPPASVINLMFYIFKSIKSYDMLLLFLKSEKSKNALISSFTKIELRLECLYHLKQYDNLIEFSTSFINTSNMYFVHEYLIQIYNTFLIDYPESSEKIKLIDEICKNASTFPFISDKYFEISFELAKYKILKNNLQDLLQKIYDYCFNHPNNMTSLNFMPHAMFLGRDLINFFDSKNYSNDYADFPNLRSIFSFFKTIVGTYSTLKLEKKNNSMIEKLELMKNTTDVVALNFLMFSVVELLFSISDENPLTTHFHVHLLIISIIKNYFTGKHSAHMLILKFFCMKHLGFNDFKKLDEIDCSEVKNILLETLPDRVEPNVVIGDYNSAIKEAEKLINFRETSLKTINSLMMLGYHSGSWKSIEEMIKTKYQFYMSYKAFNAMQIMQYHSLYLNKQTSEPMQAFEKFSEVLDIDIHYICGIDQIPQFFTYQNEYDWGINPKPFLVDNSDNSLINYCQSPPRKYNEVKRACDLHKLYALKLRKSLINNTRNLHKLTLLAFNISDLKNCVNNSLNNLKTLVKIGESLPQLPSNCDFILCDVPQQVTTWKKYDFLSTLCEFYNELSFIVEDKKDPSYSMGFTALCNQLNCLIYETSESTSIEHFPEIFQLSTILLEIFSIVSKDYRYIVSYTPSGSQESKHIRDYLSATNKMLRASISSVSEQLKKCLTYIQDPEFTVDIRGRYYEFVLGHFDITYFNITVSQIKDYYEIATKTIINNFTSSLK